MATTQFTTIRTADLLDFLCEAVDAAREAASVSPSWLRAIDAAYDYLLTTDVIEFDTIHNAIRVESATEAGKFYTANGDCQCRAFTHGKGVCWHRAAARIVRRALERRAALAPAPAVAVVPCICDDIHNRNWHGKVHGHDYVAAEGGAQVIGWVPVERGPANWPGIIVNGDSDVITVERARAIVRCLTAVLNDPRFIEAAV